MLVNYFFALFSNCKFCFSLRLGNEDGEVKDTKTEVIVLTLRKSYWCLLNTGSIQMAVK